MSWNKIQTVTKTASENSIEFTANKLGKYALKDGAPSPINNWKIDNMEGMGIALANNGNDASNPYKGITGIATRQLKGITVTYDSIYAIWKNGKRSVSFKYSPGGVSYEDVVSFTVTGGDNVNTPFFKSLLYNYCSVIEEE